MVGVPMLVGWLQPPEPPTWRWPLCAVATAAAAGTVAWCAHRWLHPEAHGHGFVLAAVSIVVAAWAMLIAVLAGSFTLGQWLGWRTR